MRGDVYRLRAPQRPRESEQRGARYAVIMQSDDLVLSTLLVIPTSKSAQPRVFRPSIMVAGEQSQVMTEQCAAVAPERLGELVGRVTRNELDSINAALRLVFELD